MKLPISTSRDQRGIALIAVLWLSVLLALISTAANRVSRSDVVTAFNAQSALVARNAAESAVDVAILSYATGRDGAWQADGTPWGWRIGDTEVRVSISDEYWRVDLNTATETVLADMLRGIGITDAETEIYVEKIITHRETARSSQRGPATEAQLRSVGHFAFGLVEDVQTVTGITNQLTDRIAKVATVYTGRESPSQRSQSARSVLSNSEDIFLTERPQPLANLIDPPDEQSDLVRLQAEARTANGALFAKLLVVKLADDGTARAYQVMHQRRTENMLFTLGR